MFRQGSSKEAEGQEVFPNPNPNPYQLVGHVSVVLPGHSLPDGRLHQTGQGWQHIDGWVDL